MPRTKKKKITFKLREAILKYQIEHGNEKQYEIAAKLWPDVSKEAQRINMSHLLNGYTKRISIELIDRICNVLGTTPNELFGYSDN